MSKKVPYVSVEKQHGEDLRKKLVSHNLLNLEFKILSEDQKLYFPVYRNVEQVQEALLDVPYSLKFGRRIFEKVESRPNSLTEALDDILSDEELELLPRAYDLVGDIAVLEIPEEISQYSQEIGARFLELHPNFETVLNKKGAISGLKRTRDYTLLAGQEKTDTIHTEYGCKIAVDLAKAYFSPRLLEEHHRVAQQVQNDELVVDMFTGVGPFALHIAKRVDCEVIAVDINPDAIELVRKSIELNKLKGEIKPVTCDAHTYVMENLSLRADRIIMNHPSGAEEFVSDACAILKSPGIIHYYDFIAEPDVEDKIVEKIERLIELTNRTASKILQVRKVRDSAPYEYQMVVDVQVR